MAHLHDLVNVLDGNYRPTTKVEAELFELQKHFIYAVFLCKVTAAEAVNIVKEEKDAKICYQALVHRFEWSPEATMDAQTLREKIRALKLDKSWNTTVSKFINHYQSLVILLESITVDPTLLWPEKLKMIMLASAVQSLSLIHISEPTRPY